MELLNNMIIMYIVNNFYYFFFQYSILNNKFINPYLFFTVLESVKEHNIQQEDPPIDESSYIFFV